MKRTIPAIILVIFISLAGYFGNQALADRSLPDPPTIKQVQDVGLHRQIIGTPTLSIFCGEINGKHIIIVVVQGKEARQYAQHFQGKEFYFEQEGLLLVFNTEELI